MPTGEVRRRADDHSDRYGNADPAATELLRRVAAYGLPGQPAYEIAPETLDTAVWDAMIGRIRHQRLHGLLQAAVEDEALPASDAQREQVQQLHAEACCNVLRLERRLLEVADTLTAASIDMVVLKGSAHAHLVYADPAQRMFGDIDFLVRSEQLERAVAVLRSTFGASRDVPEFRSGYDRRYQKSVTLRTEEGLEFDVHRNLLFGTFAFRIDLDELFDDSVPFLVGAQELRALSPEHRLLHSCFHTGFGDHHPRFSSVRDLAQMLLAGDHDPDQLLSTARSWDSEIVLTRGLELCRRMLDVEVSGPVAEAVAQRQPSKREQRAIDCYTGDKFHHPDKVLASLAFIDGWVAKAAFLLRSLLPSREFVKSRPGSWLWFRRGWRSLTHGLDT